MNSQNSEIAIINDRLRRLTPLLPRPHRLVMTRYVAALEPLDLHQLLTLIRNFNEFDRELNDPYGEHDFGQVTFQGTNFFWKFDYYDSRFEFYKENGIRVLTVMRADEY